MIEEPKLTDIKIIDITTLNFDKILFYKNPLYIFIKLYHISMRGAINFMQNSQKPSQSEGLETMIIVHRFS